MNKALVIGIGNRFRGDDAAGLDVASYLSTQLEKLVDVSYCEGDPITLMDMWKGWDCVFLIDAVTSDTGEIGYVHEFDIHEASIPAIFSNTSTHFLDVIQIVELARALERLPSTLVLYGIEGREYRMEQSISKNLNLLLPKISKHIEMDIRNRLAIS
jgi:hydrogenase maturation protease